MDTISSEPESLRFFTTHEAVTFEAIAARIWPGSREDPGAREAGALFYLDRALAGAYPNAQIAYRQGLAAVDHAARSRHDKTFHHLTEAQQDALLTDMEHDAVGEFMGPSAAAPSAAEFLALCIVHTMEGVFSDPIHGGNRGFAGWKVVGYPGPQYAYTAEEQTRGGPLNKPFKSIADW
ncbi:MAG: gluconate 2-dehydrogenase subunit 3 family protein [Armatimonadota bacterium]